MAADHLGDNHSGPELPAKLAKGEVGVSSQRGKEIGRVESQFGDVEHIFIADIFLQTE
jgi:rRNA processing protein Gar1